MADQGELGEKRIQFFEAKMQFRWDVPNAIGANHYDLCIPNLLSAEQMQALVMIAIQMAKAERPNVHNPVIIRFLKEDEP